MMEADHHRTDILSFVLSILHSLQLRYPEIKSEAEMIGNLGCNDPIKQAVKGIHASVCNAVSFTITVLI